jgi:energy-coupling factor transporter ATP-binding protein EcfA2
LDDEKIDYDKLKKALDTANIASEIERLPLGYQTKMGEQGRGLSGGQKQRILIARALYKDPDYLFFDEATNSLDTLNEQKIVAALDNVFKDKTVIVVAHRLSTIRKADQIVVMQDGFIVEIGTHESLMKKKGRYYQLVQSQLQHLSYSTNFTNAKSNQIDAEKQAQQTQSSITQTRVQKSEKLNELKIALLASYNDFMDNIALWEERYLFKSPFDGQVQFLRFWTNGQFVQAGESVFTIVPKADEPYGQILLPAVGAGKVKPDQEAIIKLNDFPYNEYGSVTGIVSGISLTTNTEKTGEGSIEAYLVTVKFPKGLTTNYGKPLAFKHEAKGTAEIITKDRRLIERLFDNLK